MKVPRERVRAVSSALFLVLIAGIVAVAFLIVTNSDPDQQVAEASDRDSAEALAGKDAGAEAERLRAQALRAYPPRAAQFSGSAPREGSSAAPSDSGQRTPRNAPSQSASLHPLAFDAQGSALGEPITGAPSSPDGAGAREQAGDRSQPASSPGASREDRDDDRYARAGDRDTEGNDREASARDEEGETGFGGDYAISGQVVDETGSSVSGIAVEAVLSRLFDEEAEPDLGYGPLEQRTFTDGAGGFRFFGLPDGEFHIRTVASARYPTVASTLSRAGLDSVKLVVQWQLEVMVSGLVESTLGVPLAGVEVTPVSQSERGAVTDESGRYGLQISMKRSSNHALRFWTEGYREQTVRVSALEAEETGGITRDVALEPERPLTTVAGVVISSGAAVADERVYLKSAQTRLKYQAVTDEAGNFAIDDVEVGDDYILWISPQGPYRQYRANNVEVPPQGLDLEISLQAEGSGRLAGRMVDFDGNPVPNFSLFLRSQGSTQQPITVTGDEQGYFALDQVPEGRLSLGTSSLPKFNVSGIQLPAGQAKEVELILDIGGHSVQGQVLDPGGNPVPAANVIMT